MARSPGQIVDLTGYLHHSYVASLNEFGTPIELPHCGGWALLRPVPGSDCVDAMGCYPLFCCRNWNDIGQDLRELANKVVSLVLVADPFGDFVLSELQERFSLVSAFKEHLIIDSSRKLEVTKHHRYYARKAEQSVTVEVADVPADYADEFADLYQHVARKHRLSGMKAFSRSSLRQQLSVPGTVLLRALSDGRAVASHVWMIQSDIAYSHLLAIDDRGYSASASYALYAAAIDYFRNRTRYIDLGSSAGGSDQISEGLYRFKRGWANATRTAYLCGAILREEDYARLSQLKISSTYFPAYRANELT